MAPLPPVLPRTVEAMYAAIERRHNEQERTYLGASIIGDECERKLWYAFRWAGEPEKFNGRMLRLFQTGHDQEARLIKDLRAAGVKVKATHKGEQIGVVDCNGHFRGHLDGEATNVPEAPKAVHVLECKTHNIKSFKDLTLNGVAKAKPMHMAQMQVYMHLRSINRALYVAVCKDDEQIYTERVHYDAEMAMRLLEKARRIIDADSPPPKLHKDIEAKEAFWCRFCPRRDICHDGGMARRNCRTCLYSTPMEDGQWFCTKLGQTLTADEQRQGCDLHLYIPGLVPGEQVDASEAGWVEYRMRDGSIWRDGAAHA